MHSKGNTQEILRHPENSKYGSYRQELKWEGRSMSSLSNTPRFEGFLTLRKEEAGLPRTSESWSCGEAEDGGSNTHGSPQPLLEAVSKQEEVKENTIKALTLLPLTPLTKLNSRQLLREEEAGACLQGTARKGKTESGERNKDCPTH